MILSLVWGIPFRRGPWSLNCWKRWFEEDEESSRGIQPFLCWLRRTAVYQTAEGTYRMEKLSTRYETTPTRNATQLSTYECMRTLAHTHTQCNAVEHIRVHAHTCAHPHATRSHTCNAMRGHTYEAVHAEAL